MAAVSWWTVWMLVSVELYRAQRTPSERSLQIRTYYSSPKSKVTDAPMFHLLLKAPNKYLPDLTWWVMTEHPAWQIMLLENFKFRILDAISRTDAGLAWETPPSVNHVISLQNRERFDYAMRRFRAVEEVPRLWEKNRPAANKNSTYCWCILCFPGKHIFLMTTYC